MFGHRRHPVLGTAVVVGASRASARREVEQQTALESQQASQTHQSAEAKRRQGDEQDMRNQKTVEEALAKASFGATAVAVPAASPRLVQAGQPLGSAGTPHSSSPAAYYQLGSAEIPQNTPPTAQFFKGSQGATGVLMPAGDHGPAIQYCPGCGNACEAADLFCGQCGRKQTQE